MTFSIQTLVALLAAVALVITCLRNWEFGVVILFMVLPFSMMIIALTAPQRGNQLDPSKKWYLFVIAKTWALSVVGLFLLGLVCFLSPYLRDRLVRGISGDMRSHQISITFPGTRQVCESLQGKQLKLYDSKGFVGNVRDVGWNVIMLQSGVMTDTRIWILVSTDRVDSLFRDGKHLEVDIRPDGNLYIAD